MPAMRRLFVTLVAASTIGLLFMAGLAGVQAQADRATRAGFDMAAWLAHVSALSSDAFEGRAPGTPGEEKTVAYLVDQFKRIGLAPAAGDGTYVQPVPLVGITATLDPLVFRSGARTLSLAPKDDFVAWTKRHVPETSLRESELVFVGYGVEAPEASWDDFKGVDLAGKTMVVLIGDPPVPDPTDPSRLDPKTFNGSAMTYYGRWIYKFDVGAARRAAGVIIVHEAAAGYGFNIVQGRLGELFDLRAADNNAGRPALEGWITLDRARELFAMAGKDFDALKHEASTRAFRPVPLGVTASARIRNVLRPVDSRNVIGRLAGSDPARAPEHVAFTAHWDAFGLGAPVDAGMEAIGVDAGGHDHDGQGPIRGPLPIASLSRLAAGCSIKIISPRRRSTPSNDLSILSALHNLPGPSVLPFTPVSGSRARISTASGSPFFLATTFKQKCIP